MIRHWKKVKTLILKMIINLTKRTMVPRGSTNSIARIIKETPLKNRIENCDRGMGTDQKKCTKFSKFIRFGKRQKQQHRRNCNTVDRQRGRRILIKAPWRG